MDDELKEALDAAKYQVRQKVQPVQVVIPKILVDEKVSPSWTDEQGNVYENDSWITDEMIEALRTKGDNER